MMLLPGTATILSTELTTMLPIRITTTVNTGVSTTVPLEITGALLGNIQALAAAIMVTNLLKVTSNLGMKTQNTTMIQT